MCDCGEDSRGQERVRHLRHVHLFDRLELSDGRSVNGGFCWCLDNLAAHDFQNLLRELRVSLQGSGAGILNSASSTSDGTMARGYVALPASDSML